MMRTGPQREGVVMSDGEGVCKTCDNRCDGNRDGLCLRCRRELSMTETRRRVLHELIEERTNQTPSSSSQWDPIKDWLLGMEDEPWMSRS